MSTLLCEAGDVCVHQSPLGHPIQIAYGVPSDMDLENYAARFSATTGVAQFVYSHHIPLMTCRVRGTETIFDHSSAYGQWGDVMVELIQEHTPPLIPADHGIHHMAFFVDNIDEGIRWCASQGWPLLLRAATSSGQEFVFCDAKYDLGHLIEMYEPTPGLLAFYDYIRQLAHIDESSIQLP